MIFSRRFQLIVSLGTVLALFLSGVAFFLRAPTSSAYSLVEQTTLSILAGSVEYLPAGETAWHQAGGGEVLKTGDRVRTSVDSRALITFFEGTTTEIEPESEVEIGRLDTPESAGEIGLELKQAVGITWSRVARIADVQSRMEIHTPVATAMVKGTEFQVKVAPDKKTEVTTTVGMVELESQGQVVPVEAGFLSVVEPGQPPSPPTLAPPARRTLSITLHRVGRLFLTDSNGRSIGFFPATGSYLNQIPGALYAGSGAGPERIDLPDPASRYRIVIVGGARQQAGAPSGLVAGWYSGTRRQPEARKLGSAGQTSVTFRLEMGLSQRGDIDWEDWVEDDLAEEDDGFALDLEVGEMGGNRTNLVRYARGQLRVPPQVISKLELARGVVVGPVPTRTSTPISTATARPSPPSTPSATSSPSVIPSATPVPATPAPPTVTQTVTQTPLRVTPTSELPTPTASATAVLPTSTSTTVPATETPQKPTATLTPTRPSRTVEATSTPIPPPGWRQQH